jgi:arsenical pump membrane protein
VISQDRLSWLLAGTGVAGLAAAVAASPADAASAASQDWSPFVLVTRLLLIGLVANDDGLFAAAGHQLARVARSGAALFAGAAVMIGLATATLNLDTSVAFLTPVLVYTARSRGGGEAPRLYGCLLLSNAGSLFLVGSNLTNLIVLGHLHLSGAGFLTRMWAPTLAALVVTAAVIAAFEHRELRGSAGDLEAPRRPVVGLGLAAVVVATVLVVALPSPALPVMITGAAVAGFRLLAGKTEIRKVAGVVGVPTLAGLFGVAVALGTLGRLWTGPAVLLSHLNLWGTAAVAAVSTVLLNNLPAASLLAARTPGHPFALLIGLNLGPNLLSPGRWPGSCGCGRHGMPGRSRRSPGRAASAPSRSRCPWPPRWPCSPLPVPRDGHRRVPGGPARTGPAQGWSGAGRMSPPPAGSRQSFARLCVVGAGCEHAPRVGAG